MTAIPFSLAQRVALVTGAGSGLGRSFAEGFAAHGAEVFCADIRGDRANETAEAIRSAGGFATAIAADVTKPDEIEAIMDTIKSAGRGVDILLTAAGIVSLPVRTHELSYEDWSRVVDINLTSTFGCTRATLPLMLSAGRGSIISIASVAGVGGYYPGFPAVSANYVASKAGVIGFTKQIACEYARDGIRANTIAPGWHSGTRLGEARRAVTTPEEQARHRDSIVSSTPMGRFGSADELQGLGVYLASDASSFVTGQVFIHDGGWTAQ